MTAQETPQIYLITPQILDPEAFGDRLAAVLDRCPVACIRLALASEDEADWTRAADQCRAVAHQRDVPLVVARHLALVTRLGLDGVHLDGHRGVRAARKDLGADAIVGSYCGTSRHDGITAGEAGADYISFGPAGATALWEGQTADRDLFEWWTEMIELPVVAEGNLTVDLVERLAEVTDFFGVGAEIWRAEDPAEALETLLAPTGVRMQT